MAVIAYDIITGDVKQALIQKHLDLGRLPTPSLGTISISERMGADYTLITDIQTNLGKGIYTALGGVLKKNGVTVDVNPYTFEEKLEHLMNEAVKRHLCALERRLRFARSTAVGMALDFSAEPEWVAPNLDHLDTFIVNRGG